MLTRLQKLNPGVWWVLPCLILGSPQLLLLSWRGPDREAAFSPLGRLAAWIAAQFTSAPSAISAGSDRLAMTTTLTLLLFAVALIAFAALAWRRANSDSQPHALLAAQLVIALAGDSTLCYVLAAQFGTLPKLSTALRWMAVQIGLLVPLTLITIAPLSRSDSAFGVMSTLVVAGLLIQVLLMAGMHVLSRERRSRRSLAVAHAELLATQALLGETVRSNERLRIARDLHDVVGHHLTALKLHLDLAGRQLGPASPAALHTAGEVAATLLAEVRVLVSAERSERHIDLRSALEALCAGVPSPRIVLSIDPQLDIESAALAHALFRCVQEAVSNAMRHADASQMHIALQRNADGELRLDISDDGRGSRAAPEGNGLRGMRERLAQWGGHLQAGDGSNGGFALQLRLPPAGAAA
jgi:two-component system sensor histidine kinase DesK